LLNSAAALNYAVRWAT